MNWRDDTKVMERICAHGVGHPDPDARAFAERQGDAWFGVHGCDGCCGLGAGSAGQAPDAGA